MLRGRGFAAYPAPAAFRVSSAPMSAISVLPAVGAAEDGQHVGRRADGDGLAAERGPEIREAVGLVMSETALSERGAWRVSAACRGLAVMLFMPHRNAAVGASCTQADRRMLDELVGRRDALPEDLCVRCPVRGECLSDALHGDELGVRGGYRHQARNRIAVAVGAESPLLLSPACGTVDGWLRHRRRGEAPDGCESCTAAARAAGMRVYDQSFHPVVRSVGDAKAVRVVSPADTTALPTARPLPFMAFP